MTRFLSCVSLVLTLLILGCGGGPPKDKPVPVSGTVKLDGKPLPEGEITFSGDGKAPETLAIANGSFSGQVRPGKRTVMFAVYKETRIKPMPDAPEEVGKVNTLPEKLREERPLDEEIKADGSTKLTFDLTSK